MRIDPVLMRTLRLAITLFAVWNLCFCAFTFAQGRLRSVGQASLLTRAVLNGDARGLKEELSRGANPNERGPDGFGPLHEAMWFARTEIAQILLDAHADPDIRTGDFGPVPSNQWTPLFFAVNAGRTELVKLLLEHSANVNLTDVDHRTPLYYALARQNNDIADLLLKAGAQPLSSHPSPLPQPSIGYYSSDGRIPADRRVMEMDEAIMQHDKAKVEALLKSGSDPNKRNPSGNTPLLAAMKCDVEIVRLLLDNGADPNMRTKSSNQWTPIFSAAYYGRDDLVSELLRHGAKVNIVDVTGKSPLWYARDQKKEAAVKALKEAGVTE